jgi:hypothetical protein
MSYYQTLIAVADDCPVDAATVPVARGGKATVATVQYELLAERPYRMTQEDVLFLSWLRRRPEAGRLAEDEVAALREEFFSRSQACLRPMESAEYRRIVEGGEGYKVVKAMRSSRR